MAEKTTEKVTAVVTTPDGQLKAFSGDTIILFTVNELIHTTEGDRVDANSVYVGSDIEDDIFEKVIGTLVGSFIEKRVQTIGKKPSEAAFILHCVSEILEERSRKIMDGLSKEELKADLDNELEKLLKMILN